MAAKIEKTTIIGDVLDIAPQTAPLFMSIGMHCLGCPASRGETVEEACAVHGVDADAFLEQVNKFIEASEEAGRLRRRSRRADEHGQVIDTAKQVWLYLERKSL